MTANENLRLSIQMKPTEQNISVIDAILFIALYQLAWKINVTSVRIKHKVHQWNDQIATTFILCQPKYGACFVTLLQNMFIEFVNQRSRDFVHHAGNGNPRTFTRVQQPPGTRLTL